MEPCVIGEQQNNFYTEEKKKTVDFMDSFDSIK